MKSRVVPVLLVILGIALFVAVTYPAYTSTERGDEGVKALQARYAENQQTLQLADELSEKREELRKRYTKIKDEERTLLAKLLPSTVDNVRLVNEIYAMARRHDITIGNVAVGEEAADESQRGSRTAAADVASRTRGYGVLPVSFGAKASYGDFENFLADLEQSLRLVDVRSVSLRSTPTGEYEWTVKLDTYWLR
jgi:Tfp pilus assembly protein PilO